jgi:hypothetical protein
MKFTTAWAQTQSQNVVLKLALFLITGCAVTFAIVAAKFALREPLLIERSCLTEVVAASDTKRSDAEVQSFIVEAVKQRFNSDTTALASFIDEKEIQFKSQELKELEERNMDQKIIVHKSTVKGNLVEVDADRLIMVGEIRSAFRFPLRIQIASTTRTIDNPYGLKLVKVERIEKEDKDEKRK